ncbi:MAG: hypothetical protein QOE76_1265 [Frankiales bacterium]|nr:hypothetical protein [Frankiales bacterium]
MTEQDSTNESELADAAVQNSPAAPAGHRPGSGADRRTDPAEPTPAANQRSGERPVEGDRADDGGVGSADDAGATTQTTTPPAAPARRRDASAPGSSAAAAGEVPVPAVEKAQDDAAGATDSATHDRPVTGVHRPSAPSGEVSPR